MDNIIHKRARNHSWNDAEKTYIWLSKSSKNTELMQSIQILIKAMRAKGFDKTLYVYTSLLHLHVSKKPSKDGGFPKEFLFIEWPNNGISVRKNGIEILQLSKCEYCPELEVLLQELESS